jgi:hypothetical protein
MDNIDSNLILSHAKIRSLAIQGCIYFDLYLLVLSGLLRTRSFYGRKQRDLYPFVLSQPLHGHSFHWNKQRDDRPTLINTHPLNLNKTHWREICQERANQSTGVNGGKLMSDEPTPCPPWFWF